MRDVHRLVVVSVVVTYNLETPLRNVSCMSVSCTACERACARVCVCVPSFLFLLFPLAHHIRSHTYLNTLRTFFVGLTFLVLTTHLQNSKLIKVGINISCTNYPIPINQTIKCSYTPRFMTLIGPVVIGVRQRSTFNYRANYLATGNASKATIIEKVK